MCFEVCGWLLKNYFFNLGVSKVFEISKCFKCFIFEIFRIRSSSKFSCVLFYSSLSKWHLYKGQNVWYLNYKFAFKNGTLCPLFRSPFGNQTSNRPVFKCFRSSDVRYLNPCCIWVSGVIHEWCHLHHETDFFTLPIQWGSDYRTC